MAELEIELGPKQQNNPQNAKNSGNNAVNQANNDEFESLVSSPNKNHHNDDDPKNMNRRQNNGMLMISKEPDDANRSTINIPTKQSGMTGAVVNFVNSIIGAGIIGLPSALNKSGFIFGIFLMFAVALMVDYGIRHLIECGVKVRKKSYEETMQYAFGIRGFYICSIVKFGFAYGAMIAYHVVIGDTIPPIFQNLYPHSALCNRPLVVCLYSIIFMLPLSCLRNMASLDKTSSLSIAAVIVIVLIVTVEASLQSPYDDMSGLEANHLVINHQWFAGVGTMAFAFVCHHNSFVVYNSLKNNTPQRWAQTTHSSLGIATFFSLWLSIVGFVNFQTNTKGDILNNFAWDNQPINFARGLLAITMVFTFPMENFVARECIFEVLEKRSVLNASNEKVWFYCLTVLLWGSSLAIGAAITDLGTVLEIAGVVCGSAIGFILPGLVSLRIFGWHSLKNKMIETFSRSDDVSDAKKTWKAKYIAAWNFIFPIFMVVFGIVVLLMGLVTVFINV